MAVGVVLHLAAGGRIRPQYVALIQIKPANGFEPMAFALQKRCSTAELSRHRLHRTGYQAIQGGVFIPDQPRHQLESITTTGFSECPADVELNGAMTDHHPLFSGGEEVRDSRFQA